jgi:epoxyqueuosine reductase
MALDPQTLTDNVKRFARSLGFDLVGITGPEPFEEDRARMLERLEAGLMDGYHWFTAERVRLATDPRALLPEARAVIALGVSYYSAARLPAGEPGRPRGRIARYAWGRDYHDVLKRKLFQIVDYLEQATGRRPRFRYFVDSGPLAERAVARRAGLGSPGKNTCLLTSKGSFVFLAELIVDCELVPDAPSQKQTCGRCTLCLQACPTGALVAPGVLDNRKCISYHTIENRGAIPRELRAQMGEWIFGCDICQDVCPYNARPTLTRLPEFEPASPERALPELIPLLELDDAAFRERFRGSPVLRAKRWGLQRNVCVALGNSGDPAAVPPLIRALEQHDHPLVRGHAAWALGRLATSPAVPAESRHQAIAALQRCLAVEQDESVREEVLAALETCGELGQEAVPLTGPPASTIR